MVIHIFFKTAGKANLYIFAEYLQRIFSVESQFNFEELRLYLRFLTHFVHLEVELNLYTITEVNSIISLSSKFLNNNIVAMPEQSIEFPKTFVCLQFCYISITGRRMPVCSSISNRCSLLHRGMASVRSAYTTIVHGEDTVSFVSIWQYFDNFRFSD